MASHKPTVSVVIPAYNEAGFIGKCLQAIAEQTVKPYEVIVVDNNSTDATAKIVRQFPFVRMLKEKRQGLRHTRNTGMDAAKGDVIARCDADSVPDPTWVGELTRLFADSSVAAATGPCYYYDMPAQKLGLNVDRMMRRVAFLGSGPLLYGSNMAVRRKAWQAIRQKVCMSGDFFEDYDLSIHLRQAGYAITFDPDLVVGVATRILDHSALTFYQTMQYHTETFAMHGEHNMSAELGKCIYLGSYPVIKLLHQAYDPISGNMSLKRLWRRRADTVRPSSNT